MSIKQLVSSVEGPFLFRETCTLLAKISWGENVTGAMDTPGDYTVRVWDYKVNRGVGVRSTNDPVDALYELGLQLIVLYKIPDMEEALADIVESTRVLMEKIPETVLHGPGTTFSANNETAFGTMSIIQTQPKDRA